MGAKFQSEKDSFSGNGRCRVIALNQSITAASKSKVHFIHVGHCIQNMDSYIDFSEATYITKSIFNSLRSVQLEHTLKIMQCSLSYLVVVVVL